MPRSSPRLGQRHPKRSLTKGVNLKEQHRQSTTVAILGADTVVGRALSLLLEEWGYDPSLSIRTLQGFSTSCSRGAPFALRPQSG
jgi:hypothetical protein